MKNRRFTSCVLTLFAALACSADCIAQTTLPETKIQRIVTDSAEISATTLPVAKAGPSAGKRNARLQVVALIYATPPAGIVLTRDGRMFLSFPRWGDRVDYSCVQILEGKPSAFPDVKTHREADHKDRLFSVQGMDFDDHGRLWLLDTNNSRLRAYNPRSREILARIKLPPEVTRGGIYANDVRVTTRAGASGGGYAFISDSVTGGVIVVDIAEGAAWRRLKDHPASEAENDFVANVEGEPLMHRAGKNEWPMRGNTDGIALSPDGKTLYFTPFSSRSLYSASVRALTDRTVGDDTAAATVKKLASKSSANDGICTDEEGRVYTTDYEDGAIRRWTPGSESFETIVQDERILWPDAVWVHEGYVYFTTNQLNRIASLHRGKDLREQPFSVMRYPVK